MVESNVLLNASTTLCQGWVFFTAIIALLEEIVPRCIAQDVPTKMPCGELPLPRSSSSVAICSRLLVRDTISALWRWTRVLLLDKNVLVDVVVQQVIDLPCINVIIRDASVNSFSFSVFSLLLLFSSLNGARVFSQEVVNGLDSCQIRRVLVLKSPKQRLALLNPNMPKLDDSRIPRDLLALLPCAVDEDDMLV